MWVAISISLCVVAIAVAVVLGFLDYRKNGPFNRDDDFTDNKVENAQAVDPLLDNKNNNDEEL